MLRWPRWWISGLAIAISVAVGALVLRRPAQQQPSPQVDAEISSYVDPAACSFCHSAIYQTYQRTGMGRSFYRPADGRMTEDWSGRNAFYHKASDRNYTMIARDGRFYQRRHQKGPDGGQTNVVEKEIHYVMGSGNHAHTYLHRSAAGHIVELPVAWYAASASTGRNAGYWAMNPGYDRPDPPDFRRRVGYDCMFCHNGYPELPAGADRSGTDAVFPANLPQGIDCQRCHGPGREHVRLAESGKAGPEAVRGAILNPARLPAERQLEVCMQCHLETTSFRLPHAIVRYERGIFSYRPQEPLTSFILHFDHPAGRGYDDKFEIAHAAYRLRKSACFRQSAGRLTCTTCHNPHDIPRDAAAVEHYTTVCRSCHATELTERIRAGRHTRSADCLGCHMPKRRTEDAIHVVMTDHYIQRFRPARDLLAPLAERCETPETTYRGEVAPYYPEKVDELDLAMAQVKNNANLKGGIPRLEQAIARQKPARVEYYFELAEAYWNAGDASKALAWYEDAIKRDPGFWPTLHRYGTALARRGQRMRAIEILTRAVSAMPTDVLGMTHLGMAWLQNGQPNEANRWLRRALEIDPDLPEAHNALGGALAAGGDRAAAQAAFREAIRHRPDYAEAHKNLGELLAATDPRLARHHLEEAVRWDPRSAAAHNVLGELLAMEGDLRAAIAAFRKAAELDQSSARPRFNLGAALAAINKPRDAEQQFRAALSRDPNYFEAHLHLARLLAATGRTTEAAAHFEAASRSPDPEIRSAAQRR